MNYEFIYHSIIYRAKYRTIDSYTERHHILPKCLGGSNDKVNIVRLTPEEHYLAHQLLVRMHPTNPKLVYAAMLMTQSGDGTRVNNRLYGWLRKRLADARRVPHSEEHRKNNSRAQTGKKLSAETRAKMSATRKGVPRPESQKIKCSEAQRGRAKTEEQKEKTRQGVLATIRRKRIDSILSFYL